MERNATKDEFEGQTQYIMSYIDKDRLNCDKFTSKIQVKMNSDLGGYYAAPNWQSIPSDYIGY